jgi:hemolysin activation/secretion protein
VIGFERPLILGPLGTEIRAEVELRGSSFSGMEGAPALTEEDPLLGRVFAMAEVERPFGDRRLVLRSTLGAVQANTATIPPQDLIRLGGPLTGPGYDFHQFAGSLGATQRVELRTPVPFVPLTLGRFGRVQGTATLAPYAHVLYFRGVDGVQDGVRPALGLGLLTLFDVLRFDVARGLRGGRWTFSVDVGRDFWSIL